MVEFRQGIYGWNFPQALRASDSLIAATLDRRSWMPPDELRDGVVIARLITGDREGARRAFEALSPFSRRPSGDFRTALLAAYVQGKAEGAPN